MINVVINVHTVIVILLMWTFLRGRPTDAQHLRDMTAGGGVKDLIASSRLSLC